MVGQSLKGGLKGFRAVPAFNAPVTHAVRGTARLLRVRPEFAVKHLPHSGVTSMVLPGGQKARLWSRGDDWVSNQVFWRGWDGYEPEVARVFWALATRAHVTLDIGAHVGYYTVIAACANPKATVYALEPLAAVFERLARNVRLNRLGNVVASQTAAGAFDGSAEFFYVPGIIPCSSSLSAQFMSGAAGVEAMQVPVMRIDTLARDHGIDRVDLVKLDTETTEPEVLAGMGDLLAATRPNIICEVLTRADTDALMAILEPLGYGFYLLTDSGPRRRHTVEPSERWWNYLFTIGAPPA